MADHRWVADVLSDLERYLQANGGQATRAALRVARRVAMDELGLQDAGADAGFEADTGHAVAGVGCVRLVVDNG